MANLNFQQSLSHDTSEICWFGAEKRMLYMYCLHAEFLWKAKEEEEESCRRGTGKLSNSEEKDQGEKRKGGLYPECISGILIIERRTEWQSACWNASNLDIWNPKSLKRTHAEIICIKAQSESSEIMYVSKVCFNYNYVPCRVDFVLMSLPVFVKCNYYYFIFLGGLKLMFIWWIGMLALSILFTQITEMPFHSSFHSLLLFS